MINASTTGANFQLLLRKTKKIKVDFLKAL